MVSSGAISAGVYQAGVNWAVLDLLRTAKVGLSDDVSPAARDVASLLVPHELVVATGASAGNVNSILAAAEWARSPSTVLAPPETSLFWEVWTGIGVQELLPEIRDARGTDDISAVLSRRHLESRAFQRVRDALTMPGVSLDRPIATGMTMTSVRPRTVSLSQDLTVQSQRMVSLFNTVPTTPVDASGTRIAFEPFAFADPADLQRFGQIAHPPLSTLAVRPDGMDTASCASEATPRRSSQTVSDNEDVVVRFSLASAAFPLAWSPVRVGFSPTEALNDEGWPATADLDSLAFLDGGVFDNNPLSLAIEAYQDAAKLDARCAPDTPDLIWESPTVFFTDPDNPRATSGDDPAASDQTTGVAYLAGVVGSLVGTGRQYELETVSRSLPDSLATALTVTSRGFPVVGLELNAFAAFLGRPFRVFDFYSGVYDGYVYAASRLTSTPTIPLDRAVEDLFAASQLDSRDPRAGFVFRSLFEAEFGRVPSGATADASTAATYRCPVAWRDDQDAQWQCVLDRLLDVSLEHDNPDFHDYAREIHRWYNTRRITRDWASACPDDEPDVGLICDAAPHLPDLIRSPTRWFAGSGSEVLNFQIESERRSGTTFGRQTSVVAMLALNVGLSDTRPGLQINRSVVPEYGDGIYGPDSYRDRYKRSRAFMRYFLPSRLSLSEGGGHIAHDLSVNLSRRLRANASIHALRYGPIDAPMSTPWHLSFGAEVGLRFGSPVLGFHAAAVHARPYGDPGDGAGLGYTAALHLLHFFRIGVEQTVWSSTWTSDDVPLAYDDDIHLTVGVHDVGGLAYWLRRAF